MIPSYPKVYQLGHRWLADLFEGQVYVQEKVDGSQFSFGFIGKTLYMRSKSATVAEVTFEHGEPTIVEGPGAQQFRLAIDSILARASLLHPDTVYRGEFLAKPKHNTLAYDRVPKGNVVIFDVEDVGLSTPRIYHPIDLITETERIGLENVPYIDIDHLDSGVIVDTVRNTDSMLGGQKIEGLVFKNYTQFGMDGKFLAGKYVSEAFKEVHQKDWKERNPAGADIIETIGAGLRTPARWNKAVQHLRDRGELLDAPQDIGPLMKEVSTDLHAEVTDEVKEALFKWAWPKIQRLATRGLPEWYKEQLLENQFQPREDESE
jgi:hypothetical protein